MNEEQLEARWRDIQERLTHNTRDAGLALEAAKLAEQMGRRPEAYVYYGKAAALDPSIAWIPAKMRPLADTPEQKAEVEKLARRPKNFWEALDDVFSYPLRGGGLPVLAVGALVFAGMRAVLYFNTFMPMVSWAGLWFISAYLAMFYADVCGASATGSDDLPQWPDPMRLQGFLLDMLKIHLPTALFVVPIFLLLGGAAVVSVFGAADGDPSSGTVFACVAGAVVLGAIGIVYVPMGILANCMYGHPAACLNPVFVARSILAAPANYGVAILILAVTVIGAGILEMLAATLDGLVIPLIGVATLIEFYATAVQMRVLGVFYRFNQAKLGWFAA